MEAGLLVSGVLEYVASVRLLMCWCAASGAVCDMGVHGSPRLRCAWRGACS